MIDAYARLTNRLVSRVNEQRGVGRRTRDAIAPRQLRGRFVEAILAAASSGLLSGALAEASVRLSANQFLMTPRAAWLALLDDRQLVIASTTTALVGESQMPYRSAWHHLTYARIPAANAVVFCQPPAAMIAARRGLLSTDISDTLAGVLGEVVLTSHDTVEQDVGVGKQLLIAGEGLLCHGDDITHALLRAEAIDQLCRMAILDASL